MLRFLPLRLYVILSIRKAEGRRFQLIWQNVETWKRYDSTELLQTASHKLPILIDVGSEDALYPEVLQPEVFVRSAREKGFNIQSKVRPGYGHDYFFIASFIDSHIEFHAQALGL